ncbi:MAG: LruC domain-containing protein, partial [Croceimicrobium sp.]
MRKIALLLSLASVLMVSCSKEQNPSSDQSAAIIPGELNELDFPTNFDFNTSREIRAEAVVHSLDGNPLAGTRISFYNQNPELGAKPIAEGVSDASGRLDMPLTMPAYSEQVYVVVHSSGFANSAIVPAKDFTVSFGGKPGIRNLGSGKTSALLSRTPISGNYYYIGTFSSGSEAGLPNYLENPGDVISQELLDDVDASLPESAPVPSNNPSYLTVGNELDLVIEDQSDVWVTFVTEGAGYKNALGYYVFDSQNPPATVNDIDSIFVVLPNASLDGAGGKLQAGDKVKLGTFDAGKTISWVLLQNAWNGSGVNVNSTKYYSRIDFNTMESDPSKRQHTVQLADIGRQILIVGFEDQTRSTGSDNDFNDLVFYIRANPWEKVDISNMPRVTPEDDCDNDGVSDASDDFPCDPARAVRNTYTGTLSYEDLWPSQGDYDFNDMVVDYEIDHILNGANQLVEIEADWTVRAVGAAYENGFGFTFDGLDPNVISSVNGHN